MKRLAAIVLLSVVGASVLFAEIIDKPVATVKLTKIEVISVKQFRQKIEALEARRGSPIPVEEREKLLDLLVSEILINQAAAKDNVTATQAEVDARVALAKQSGGAGLNLNRELTDAEFRSLLQQSGMSWEDYQEQLKQAIVQQKYVLQRKKAFFDRIPEPSDSEVEDFYESNKTAFVAPDMVRFQHVFIDTRNLSSKEEKDKARQRAEEIYRELRNGAAFADLVVKYSDDRSSRYKGGDFGYLRRDDQARKQLLGREFFEAPFKMKVGDVSGVLESNIGFHIIKITEKIPFKLLGLDDPVPPQNTSTVRDEIKAQLLQRKQAEYYQRALMELVDELKKKAEIKVFRENLTW
jgi:parvulin-like peptidyl-prolyl isomerase